MNKEELKFIFDIFCESWHLNSYSGYYRNLMFQIDDFKSITEHLKLSPEETIYEYRKRCEENRLELMRNFNRYSIEWRNLEFNKFEQSETKKGDEYHFPFEVKVWGSALLSDKKIDFRILDLKILKAVNGYVLNVDTCSNEIRILE